MTKRVYIFRTSFAQQRLWFLDQLAPGNSFYSIHSATRLSSPPNVAALERSLNEIVRRHESLRTAFKAVGGEPVQVVAESLTLALPVVDLGDLPESEREDEAMRIAAQEARQPFDLSEGPLLRASMLRIDEKNYIFLLTIHHIVCDFWSMNVLFEELATHYKAFCAGEPSLLPEPPIQYADYAEWEWQCLRGSVGESHLNYWKKQLADLPMLQMPTDFPRPAVQSFKGSVCSFWIAGPLYLALLELSRKEGVTLFMTLLAAFKTLLNRYTGQDDVAVGTPVANRNRAELEGLIGLFANTLVLRTNLSGNPRFRELLGRVREVALDAYGHQDLPFEKLVRELKPERDMGRNPLFQVHFQLLSDLGGPANPGPIEGESLEIERGAAIFDLALDLWEYPDGLQGMLEYSTDLFNEETIGQMVEHFRILLEGIVADSDQRLSELPLLTSDEREQLLVDWNVTETPYPRERCLHELFETQVERTPDAIAISFGSKELTYGELNHRANQLAHYLQALGVGPEHLVAICTERSLEMVVGLLGILKAGGAYLPLESSYPEQRLRFILKDSQPQVLLTQSPFVQRVSSTALECLCLDEDWERVASYSDANPVSKVESHHLAYVIYTSGSTGEPKGVQIPHHAVCNHLIWMLTAYPMTEEDRIAQKYPFNFDASVCEIFCPLLAGARLIITEPSKHWDMEQFIKLLTQKQITILDLMPSMLQALLEDERFSACRSIRRCICGGESLSPALRDRFFSQLDAELINAYGPTEATIGSTAWTCRRGDSEYRVPIGRPISNTQIYILDPHLNPVPIGVPGELYVGGDGLARGYLNRPDLTAERFISNPFSRKDGGRLYKTGDMGRYLPDGSIEYLARMDQQLKLRGYRIELGEIESVMATHSSVRNCAVFATKDVSNQTKLVAYIVPTTDAPELWPSVGEYGVYDEVIYYAMTHDERRNRSYRAAINQSVNGKVVLDIGTGADAVLARLCIDGGAERVYAIEINESAYHHARELVERLGLGGKIILIQGDSTRVELPEKVDVCLSELLGMIGSSEGVVSILNDSRRFLKPGGIMIPQRCVTRVAPICLPQELAGHPTLTELPRFYVEEVFKKLGHPFDLRMCIKNFPQTNLLSETQVFEDLDFTNHVEPEYESEVTFTINKNSRLDGFLLWLNLYVANHEMIDSLNHRHNWLPVFFPTFYPGLEVSEGDVIKAVCSCQLSTDARMPDFRIRGTLNIKGSEPIAFDYSAMHRTKTFKASPFYESLFAGVDSQPPYLQLSDEQKQASSGENAHGLVPNLRRFLREQLPEYMIPSSFVVLGDLPMTENGKIDRRALPELGQQWAGLKASYVAPSTEVEHTIADIWREVLNLAQVGVNDNFFDAGGDSLLISRVRSRLALLFNKEVSIVDLFRNPTVSSLAKFLSQEDAKADSFRQAQERARKQIDAVHSLRHRIAWTEARNE
jgi:amino acid adenylation domain-containing protein